MTQKRMIKSIKGARTGDKACKSSKKVSYRKRRYPNCFKLEYSVKLNVPSEQQPAENVWTQTAAEQHLNV